MCRARGRKRHPIEFRVINRRASRHGVLPIMGCANGKAYGSAMDDPHAKDPAVTDDWECKAEALRLFNLVHALRICPCHSCLQLTICVP